MDCYTKKKWYIEMIVRPMQARVDTDRNQLYFSQLKADPDLKKLDEFVIKKLIPDIQAKNKMNE